ncbi:MAG: phosphatidylglycerol lysyltransferase domain-containing protein [Rhodobacteraceae bacterium]|nr:phosphatidylglycerol lysyltransferase domain-containing protein [Paracoccaceae bacterium]
MRTTAIPVSARPLLRQAAQRIGLSLLVLVVCLLLLQDRIDGLDLAGATRTLAAFSPGQWAAALLATALSFWAVGRYDALLHRHLATGVAGAEAQRAGIAAIAISQTLGAGVFTGALVRWRMLRGVSLWQATRLSLGVALSFLGGWAVVTGFVLCLIPGAPMPELGAALLAGGAVALICGAVQPARLRWLQLPNAFTQVQLVMLTGLDTLAACAALYLLLPAEAGLTPALLLPAFLLALGAGLVSGTPGGVGPFEMTLLALLPQVPAAPLLAAVLGWRMIYFALPALLGAALAAHGPARHARGADAPLRPVPAPHVAGLLLAAPRAEIGLVHQGHLSLMQSRLGGFWLTGRTAHLLIGLLDPIGDNQPQRATLHALARQARTEGRTAAIYKCGGRTAATARALGWHIVALGPEARLDPARFSLEGPAMASLRRKLRRAMVTGGLTLHLGDARGAAERAAIARLWARARRGERGFSMGRYAEPYLDRQQVIEARVAGRLVGFASFHQAAGEWTLDLMRHAPDAPDGTMQAIVCHALTLARAQGVPRLSLAACGPPPGLPPRLRRLLHADDAGLLRFKQMFAPDWHPMYLAAPSRSALALAAVELARAIHAPPPLRPMASAPQDHLAENEFAPRPQPWQRVC